MFKYQNPSNIIFETGILENHKKMKDLIGDGDYCIFTYSDDVFKQYTNQIIKALGEPKLIVNNILPNPDYKNLKEICNCLLYTSPSPRDATLSRMPSSA